MPLPSPLPSTDRGLLTAALAEHARRGAPGEPEVEAEELLDYLAGRLAPEEAQRLERILVASPVAARALLDVAELEAAGAAGGRRAGEHPAELAVLAGWRDFKRRLPGAPSWSHRLTAQLLPIAASLLIATLGLGGWVWKLQNKPPQLIASSANLELSTSRGDLEAEVPSGGALRLVIAPAERCPAGYAVRLEGPGSGDSQTREGLELNSEGNLTPVFSPPLEPGPYRLLVLGCEPRRELEEHRFRVTRADDD